MNKIMRTITSYIRGPRWARSDQAIKNKCWSLGLKCRVERETTLLRETVRFTVEGEEVKLLAFIESLELSVREWNK